ncbi:HNH endonuclease [Clostridium perfringens]|uniref:HNH endonuclease n=1 Tax=Clostridium perfringens TaxID=1502 RepID=UPI0018E4D384|nr:HNH endonuclease [Clostridium perfringens]MBI6065010.1 hypothetical protein [Clostridium perfringens]
MARLISCNFCFGYHPKGTECSKKPKKDYKLKKENLDEVNKMENKFYSSSAWQKTRASVMRECGWKCYVCSNVYPDTNLRHYTEAREVHHVIPIRDCWDKRLDVDNLVCLCTEHHHLIHQNNIRNKFELEKFINNLKRQ